MFSNLSLKLRTRGAIVAMALVLAGCGQGLSGKYSASNGVQSMTLDFQSGDKVMATIFGSTAEGTYKVDGDKVTVEINGKNAVFTKAEDGSLTGGPMGMILKKQ